jgi:hypothetical protein
MKTPTTLMARAAMETNVRREEFPGSGLEKPDHGLAGILVADC